jgi:hypothetical protein
MPPVDTDHTGPAREFGLAGMILLGQRAGDMYQNPAARLVDGR